MARRILQANLSPKEDPIAKELRVNKDGKGTITFRGAARICGVTVQSLRREGVTIFPDKLAQKLIGQGFEVSTFSEWKKSGIPDIAVAVIVEYYAFDAGERCTDAAITVFRSFAAIGIRSWIQKELGWEAPSDVQLFVDRHVTRESRDWELVFDRSWRIAAEQCTGWKWSNRCMRHLIDLLVYDRLPSEVRQTLDEYNPVLENGFRARKQHQHFSAESVEHVLKLQLEVSRSLMMVSTSWDELKENARRRFEGMAQLKLLS